MVGVADRNHSLPRLEAAFSMFYGKSAIVVFVYDVGRLHHKSLENTASRLPYILSYRYRKFSDVAYA